MSRQHRRNCTKESDLEFIGARRDALGRLASAPSCAWVHREVSELVLLALKRDGLQECLTKAEVPLLHGCVGCFDDGGTNADLRGREIRLVGAVEQYGEVGTQHK